MPKRDADGSPRASIAAISSNSKSNAYRHNKKCVVQQVMLLERSLGNDVPAPVCMIMLTIATMDDVTDRGVRYNAANKERIALRKKENAAKAARNSVEAMHVNSELGPSDSELQ